MFDGKGMGNGISAIFKLAIILTVSLAAACVYIIFFTDSAFAGKIVASIFLFFVTILAGSALDWKYIWSKLQFWKKNN